MAHSVDLKWDAPVGGDPFTGYNVYRKQGTGAFVKIASPTAALYTDNDAALVAGQQFTYQITSFNPTAESAPSMAVTVTIPFLAPGIPTNLVATAH